MKRSVPVRIGLFGLAVLGIFSCVQIRTNPQVCHLVHLVSPPDDLRRPIVLDRNLLRSMRPRYEYTFEPEYCEIYEIGFLSDFAPLPPSFDPGLRVRARIISDSGNLLAEIDRIKPVRISQATSGYGAGKISYGSFEVSRRNEQVAVVLEISGVEDLRGEEISSLDLFVAVSGSP